MPELCDVLPHDVALVVRRHELHLPAPIGHRNVPLRVAVLDREDVPVHVQVVVGLDLHVLLVRPLTDAPYGDVELGIEVQVFDLVRRHGAIDAVHAGGRQAVIFWRDHSKHVLGRHDHTWGNHEPCPEQVINSSSDRRHGHHGDDDLLWPLGKGHDHSVLGELEKHNPVRQRGQNHSTWMFPAI